MKNNYYKVALTLVAIIMFFFACKQELLLPEATKDVASMEVETRASDVLKTVLGKKRTNPYTIENINKAYQIAFKTTKTLAATHYYIKFKPNTAQELKALIDTDLSLYDYPLDYEVTQMGEFYHDPAVPADKPTYLYGAVKIGTTLPNVPYERLATLYLSTQNSTLTRKALELAGYNPDAEGYITDENETMPGTNVPSTDPIILPRALAVGSLVRDANCDCKNGVQARNPAGCVRVQDTQLSTNDKNTYKAVRQVKVVVKDNWFIEIGMQTNDAGCFSRTDKKLKGKAWVWVKFANNKGTLRMINGIWTSYMVNYARTVTDYVGWFSGGVYNNMDIFYDFSADNASTTHRFWRSATIMNGLQEYHDYCAIADITPPPFDLKILSSDWEDSGAAPMLNKLVGIPTGQIGGKPWLALWGYFGGATIATLYPPVAVLWSAIGIYMRTFAPDVVVSYKTRWNRNSDQIKNNLYHELGHASHFAEVGNDFWLANANYILDNGAYGDGTKPGADRCAVIEMWGFYIEKIIAERAYGLNHSNSNTPDPQIKEDNRNVYLLEGTFLVHKFIKSGLLYDINDINRPEERYEHAIVKNKDKISGYLVSDIFKTLTREIDTPIKLKDKFRRNKIGTRIK